MELSGVFDYSNKRQIVLSQQFHDLILMEIDVVLRIGGDFGDLGEEELSLLEDIGKHGLLYSFFFCICYAFYFKFYCILIINYYAFLLFQHI